MKLLLINSVCGATSTGRITTDIYDAAKDAGYEVKIAYGEFRHPNVTKGYDTIPMGSKVNNYLHAIGTRITDRHGLFSKRATKNLIKEIDNMKPDIIHIHNLHGYYINYEILFDYLKAHESIKVFWTLHDCWALTGHCAYYSQEGCEKWKTGCQDCPLKSSYPSSKLKDNSRDNYLRKKKAFTGLKNLTVLVPSQWMKKQVEESFLKDYRVEVVENGVNLDSFKIKESDFKKKHKLEDKKLVVGVANIWAPHKGLKYFMELAEILKEKQRDDIEVVIVGRTNGEEASLASNMLWIPFTNSPEELNEIYNGCDLFVTFSSEETFGLTVVEAMAAGIYPVVMENTACEDIVRKSAGTACPRDAMAVYDCISSILDGSEKVMSREDISSMAAKYSLEAFKDKVLTLYK